MTAIVAMIAEGMTVDQVLEEFPQLKGEDIREALKFAAAAVDEHELPLRAAR